MDVQKIQKINDLALKLQQQAGFDREESVRQAERMLSKDDNLEVNEITAEKVKEMDHKPVSSMTWQEAMEKNTKFIVNEFKDIQKEIINLKAEMQNLNHKIKNMALAPPTPPPEARKETQAELPKEKHPKQGDCSPKDFSVEKYFYFGNKNK